MRRPSAAPKNPKNPQCAEQFDAPGTVTASDVILAGGDWAEEIEPGAVLVIDERGALEPCSKPYDRRVAGVVSGAGGLRPGIVLDQRPGAPGRATIALVGKVYCKADADFGSIEVGDLLTTSPTPGCAMKATEPAKAFGAVIGKALAALGEGRGLIPSSSPCSSARRRGQREETRQ